MNKPSSDILRLLQLAIGCIEAADFHRAIKHLEALLRIDSRHELAQGTLGAIHAHLGKPDLAADCYLRVLDCNPDNALARFQLGLLQLAAAEPEKALVTWQPCLRDAKEFLAHFHTAALLMQLGRVDEARPLLETAAARMPVDYLLYPALQELMQSF